MTDQEKVLYDKLTHLEVVVESLLDLLIQNNIIDYVELQQVVDKNMDIILEKINDKKATMDEETQEDDGLDDSTIPLRFWGPGGDA